MGGAQCTMLEEARLSVHVPTIKYLLPGNLVAHLHEGRFLHVRRLELIEQLTKRLSMNLHMYVILQYNDLHMGVIV